MSHILDYLPQRNRESIEKKSAYPEFLSLLLQDELLGRENKKFQARFKRANIDGNKTLEKYDFDFNSRVNRAQIQELASCRFLDDRAPVLIVGPCGTGKFHIAQAIAHCAIRQGIDALWLQQSKLFSELQAAKAAGRYEKKFAEWGNAFPNKLLAAATLDRLRHNAYKIILDGPSFRGDREGEKSAKMAGKNNALKRGKN